MLGFLKGSRTSALLARAVLLAVLLTIIIILMSGCGATFMGGRAGGFIIGGGPQSNTGVIVVSLLGGTYSNLFDAYKYGGGPVEGCQQLTSGEALRCIYRPRGSWFLDNVRGEVLIQVCKIGTGKFLGYGTLGYYDDNNHYYQQGNFPVYVIDGYRSEIEVIPGHESSCNQFDQPDEPDLIHE